MPIIEPFGFPPLVENIPGIDVLGSGCRISPTVTVFRARNLYTNAGIFLGDEVMLFDQVRLLLGEIDTTLSMGNRIIINVGGYISGEGGLQISDDVIIGPHVRLLSAGHEIHTDEAVVARNKITYAPIRIDRGAWIGGGATVLQGVTIGEGAVVGAGSVVTQNVPPFAVVAGNPARLKRYRSGSASLAIRRNGWWRVFNEWLSR